MTEVLGQDEWDERYGTAEQIWSGDPNGALVAEVAALQRGRALDVGCGEGADAIWLAAEGWQVTALDVSRVALDRAQRHAVQAGVEVQWLHAGLLDADLEPSGFDLVSAQYPALRLTGPDDETHQRALLAAVAPGGTLLVVHHHVDQHGTHGDDHEHGDHEHGSNGFDPADYVMPADVARLLDDGWQVAVNERRPRHLTSGAGAGHAVDLVLRATRLP